jgi:hypothetical protein
MFSLPLWYFNQIVTYTVISKDMVVNSEMHLVLQNTLIVGNPLLASNISWLDEELKAKVKAAVKSITKGTQTAVMENFG